MKVEKKKKGAVQRSSLPTLTSYSLCYIEVNWLYLSGKPSVGTVIKTILAKENIARQTAVEKLRGEIVTEGK